MKLYLVQHGKAHDKEQDPERHLTAEGENETKRVAGFLSVRNVGSLNKIYHSGKTRAKETADIFGLTLKPEGGVEKGGNLHATDDVTVWGDRLKELEGQKEVMLVGHLPYMSKIASYLLNGDKKTDIVNFKNSGVVCLSTHENGEWELEWAVTPDIL